MPVQKIKNYNGFTLVELIVVIVILAILATIAFLSFSSQSGSARDSTRLADISSIKKSVEMYNVYSWTYPSPDNSYSYTYSGWTIWNQWTIWESAYKMLQKNLSKKVTDPLKWSEYDYSLASNKREYQVAWNFENPTSYEKSLNPFHLLSSQFSSLSSSEANALGWTGANVYISWNYNWVMLKVSTWSTYYFIPTPTLFWLNSWTWNVVYDSTFWSWNILLPWVNNLAVFDSSKVYASTSSTWLSVTEVADLMTKIQSAYSNWNVTAPAVQAIVAASWASLTDIGIWLLKNSLGWGNTQNSGGSDWTDTPSSDDTWRVLLLHWDNPNTASVLDSSSGNKTMVTTGNATQLWKFNRAWYFNGTNSYLNLPNSSDFDMWTWDFSIDFWFNTTNVGADQTMLFMNWASSTYASVLVKMTNRKLLLLMSTSGAWWNQISTSSDLIQNQWYHVAVVRKTWTVALYLDGAQVGTASIASQLYLGGITYVWALNYWTVQQFFNWYIDELRISKWTSRWFVPGFSLPTSPYNFDANDSLLMHFDGSWNSFADSTGKNTITAGSTATQTVSPKFGNWSLYFDWINSYLSSAGNSDFDFWSGSFTIDYWEYRTAVSTHSTVTNRRMNTSWIYDWIFRIWYVDLPWYLWHVTAIFDNGAWTPYNVVDMGTYELNAWNHFAVVRSWGNLYTFKNWQLVSQIAVTFTLPSTTDSLLIWRMQNNGYYYNGYVDEFHISKWIAKWTSDFTPPTSSY
ncbi:MAG: laminin G [uncultured bacterium (gcode 4)]|uniref:Laminin G n=1 Tax=uncultured bacterium (gcode 4) TaxID=1234023 RepID=K2H0X2_9BACT|nr:MAG: laminin G [uncultured bacterium (gcode 4)]